MNYNLRLLNEKRWKQTIARIKALDDFTIARTFIMYAINTTLDRLERKQKREE